MRESFVEKPFGHDLASEIDTRYELTASSSKYDDLIGTILGNPVKGLHKVRMILRDRPVILALSNPTDHAECPPEQAYTWSNGKAIYAAGVQFPPVHFKGQTFLPGQANNFYIFPAIGMAVFATQASRVSDGMFIEAARAVADQVPSELLKQGLLYPPQANILETEIHIAARTAKPAGVPLGLTGVRQ